MDQLTELEKSSNDEGDRNPSQGETIEVECEAMESRLNPKSNAPHRRILRDDENPRKERRIGRLRRKLGRKAAAPATEGSIEDSLEQSLDVDFSTEGISADGLKCHLPAFQDDSSHLEDSDSEDHVETSNDSNVSNESSDFNEESEQLAYSNDGQVARGHNQGLASDHAKHGAVVGYANRGEWLRTKHKVSFSPPDIDRNMWPIDEKVSAESENESEEAAKRQVNSMQQETPDKRKGFHLPTLRMQKKPGQRKVEDLPIPSPTNHVQVSADSVDGVGSQIMELDQGGNASTPTRLRQRKPFGLMTPKSPVASQSDSAFREDRQQGANKGLHLKFSRGQKTTRDDEASSTGGTKREKVSEKIKRTLGRGGVRDRKEASAAGERDDSWEWGDSDTDNDDGISHKSRAESALDGYHSIHDGLDSQVSDTFNFDTSGVLPPVKSGVPLKFHQFKDTKELRVRPYHCFAPHKVFMTEDEIYQNMLRPSEIVEHVDSSVEPWCKIAEPELTEVERSHWGSPQDGRIGSLRVEVLGCVGISKYKADVSVYLVCGDAAFATDVIHGSRSPMWPACSKRAACFPIFHAYVTLYVGVFDVTTIKKSENDIFFGRVAVDIASLRPDSEYDVSLALRASSFVYDRRPRGVVRFRLCLHWFSERAAILSYLHVPRHVGSAFVESPSIPCADPKTFRNVAVTIHGQELPGKYTRKAFQATMREFNLYQQNIRFMVKAMIRDAVLYVNPLMSLYIFVTWMHCVWCSSLRLVPVYFVGFLILILLEGYLRYGPNSSRNLGFSRVSLQEIVLCLLNTTSSSQIQPILAEKKAISSTGCHDFDTDRLDHMEFPFSDGKEYRKRAIGEVLVKRSTSGIREQREDQELQGRLSIYVQRQGVAQGVFGAGSRVNEVDDESIFSGHDSEIGGNDSDIDQEIHGDVDNAFDLDSEEEDEEPQQLLYQRLSSSSVAESSFRSKVVLGPPQDADIKPKKKIPPQVHLARFEERLDKLTHSLSMDKVFSSMVAFRAHMKSDDRLQNDVNEGSDSGGRKKVKRIPLDEFDKRLGYRIRHPNPVTEITSSFLGPLMRIFRILCCVVRIVFNVGIWSDPFMSFWVLCFLIAIMLLLVLFPWRLFFLVVGVAAFGPQNILVRRRLERRAASQSDSSSPDVSAVDMEGDTVSDDDKNAKKPPRRTLQNPIAKLKERRQKKLAEKQELQKNLNKASGLSALEYHPQGQSQDSRRPFCASGRVNKKLLRPREIVVPYTRFHKERFFDWPPDPTVARATPLQMKYSDYRSQGGSQ